MSYKDLKNLIKEYRSAEYTQRPNYILIPVSVLPASDESLEKFNKIYQCLLNQKYLTPITRTKSGGIKVPLVSYKLYWDIRAFASVTELTIIADRMYRLQFRAIEKNKENTMYGAQAFKKFKAELHKDNVEIDDYKISNGDQVRFTVPSPIIRVFSSVYKNYTFNNVHHIDFHNSYPAGLANTHPEFRKTIERLYKERDIKPVNKQILNYSIGFMHSQRSHWQWAQLVRDAKKDNNDRVMDLSSKLSKSGRIVLLYNTDGIWYRGDVYHDSNEGPDLGQWHNDHLNCTLRIKSDGCYEYIEDNVYYPVIRGIPNELKANWVWGDIYKHVGKRFVFVKGIGMVKKDEI